jgi:hypothetical protein
MKIRGLLSGLLFCCGSGAFAQAPIFHTVTPNHTVVGQFDLFELSIDLTAVYNNPYDYEDITVHCEFTSPEGKKDTVEGFFLQDYTLNTSTGSLAAKGTGNFRVRYAPREVGSWQYHLSCTTRSGTTKGPVGSLRCKSSHERGFVRRNQTNYLQFDDGVQYIPIGENMGWAHANAYMDYHQWVGKLAANKGNFIRVWMPSWGLGLEWQQGRNGYSGLKHYKQENARLLDWLVEYCREKGVYMMLSLDHHGQVSSKVDPNWNENPYNAANGGPCRNTWDFFTDSVARQSIRNRFRYIVARYGYSSHIMCWELFNEVEWTDDYARHKGEITAWHEEMAGWLRSKDVNQHLITTSYASAVHDPATWNLTGIDFTQTHYYAGISDLDSVLSRACQTYIARYGKPSLTGEFGLSVEAGNLAAIDPTGIYVHNSLWGTMLGGGLGAGLPWYWDNYIEPQNLYTHFSALANFVSGIAFSRDRYAVATVKTSGDGGGLRASVLKSADHSRVAGWVLNRRYNWKDVKEQGRPAGITGASIILPGVKDGVYRVRWSDCKTGVQVSAVTVRVTGQELRLACPKIDWDLSVVAERVR